MHGFAINVHPDLSYYDGIIPCGIFEYGVTSMEKLLGMPIKMEAVKAEVENHFNSIFNQERIMEISHA